LVRIDQPIQEPVSNYQDGAALATQKVVCFASPFLAGLALRTPQTALFAVPFLLYSALACGGDNNDSVPRRQFVGGQCAVSYRIEIYWKLKDFPGEEILVFQNGPVHGIELRAASPGVADPPYPPFELILNVRDIQVPVANNLGGINEVEDYFLVGISREDGGLDNCGDPPPFIPNPPADPGEPPYPPIVFPPGGGPVYIDFELPGGETVPVPFTIGPININVGELFPFNLNINGARFIVNPDFELLPEGPGGGLTEEQSEQLNEAFDEVDRLRLQQVHEEVFEVQTISLVGGDCGEEAETVEVSGNAFDVMAAAFTQESLRRYSQTKNLCPAPSPENVDEILLYSELVSGEDFETHSELISEDVRSVRIVITSFDPNIVPSTRIYPGAEQFKFGVVSFSVGDSSGSGPFLYLYDVETFFVLPRRSLPGRVRILAKRTVGFSVYDTGERYLY